MAIANRLILPPRNQLPVTSDVDFGRKYYGRGPLAYVMRQRLRLALRLIGMPRSILELGYGSGIFLPALAKRCRELVAIDRHSHGAEVAEMLEHIGVTAQLHEGDVTGLDFPNGHFDTVVAVSVLEFIGDLDKALSEIGRVMSDDGRFVVVTPGISSLLDGACSLLAGRHPEVDFQGRRQGVRPALLRHFSVDRHVRYPGLCPVSLTLYDAYVFSKPSVSDNPDGTDAVESI